jgi:hypothetical protein
LYNRTKSLESVEVVRRRFQIVATISKNKAR